MKFFIYILIGIGFSAVFYEAAKREEIDKGVIFPTVVFWPAAVGAWAALEITARMKEISPDHVIPEQSE